MMNMGSRGIIAAVLDNDSDSDTEASKGRNRHWTAGLHLPVAFKGSHLHKLTSLCISQFPYRRLLRSSTSHGPRHPLQQVGHQQPSISAPWRGRALSAVTHWLTSRWRCTKLRQWSCCRFTYSNLVTTFASS